MVVFLHSRSSVLCLFVCVVFCAMCFSTMAIGSWLSVIRIYVVDISIQCVLSFQVSDITWVGAGGL
jgi:hypothetical protein